MVEERKVVTASPENSETPLDEVRSWVTPTRLFFVRNHFATPAIDVATWRLATGECAGNGRSFLRDKVRGVQWGAGAIGHAEWTGVPLRLVLERSGVLDD